MNSGEGPRDDQDTGDGEPDPARDSERNVPNPRQPPLDWHAITTFTYQAEPRPPRFQFSHDEQKRLFVLTMPDGRVEHFRDNPVRYLVVEREKKTGRIVPVAFDGRPQYLLLCREEIEDV